MAENHPPAIPDSDLPRIDFKKTSKSKGRKSTTQQPMSSNRNFNRKNGLLSPPSSQTTLASADDEDENIQSPIRDASRTLISPPPEEELRLIRISHSRSNSLNGNITTASQAISSTSNSTVKRKRSVAPTMALTSLGPPSTAETTPNPKPRKQSRQQHGRTLSEQSITLDMQTPSKSKSKHVVFQSPHATNPDADFLPQYMLSPTPRISSRAQRRSATPVIPFYEPPSEHFTPPREIILSPVTTKSAKKKATSARKSQVLRVDTVKKELPAIDLTLPMPPPSPSDDPLLLSGQARRKSSRHSARTSLDQADTYEPLAPAAPSPPGSPMNVVPETPTPAPATSSPVDEQPGLDYFNWDKVVEHDAGTSEMDDSMDLDEDQEVDGPLPLPLFDLNNNHLSSDAGWSDSDEEQGDDEMMNRDDAQEGEGEYTGKFQSFLVKTKADPPSSVTRERMDSWGNPSSPFPYERRPSVVMEEAPNVSDGQEDEEEEEKEEEEVRQLSMERDLVEMDSDGDESEREEVRQMSIERDLAEVDSEMEDDFQKHGAQSHEVEDATSREPPSPLEDEGFQEDAEDGCDVSLHDAPEHNVQVPDAAMDDNIVPSAPTSKQSQSSRMLDFVSPFRNDVAERVFEGAGTSNPSPTSKSYAYPSDHVFSFVEHDREVSGESDSEESDLEDVVKITSSDPRAAARATAILKQHNYDCFTKAEAQRRKLQLSVDEFSKMSRRKSVSTSGISKSAQAKRRETLGSVIGDKVYLPGSPVTTLKGLLVEAEKEVSRSPKLDFGYSTPVPTRFSFGNIRPRSSLSKQINLHFGDEKEWTKEDWKKLDSCFTDERYTTSDDGEAPAAADAVRLEDVVNRFMQMEGGKDVIQEYGWSRALLLQRASALQNKQRAGRGAPPTTPSSTPNSTACVRRLSTFEVPDFTPLARRSVKLPQSRLSPATGDYPFKTVAEKVPGPLLAPRYSLLLEEATAISQETPSSLPAPVTPNAVENVELPHTLGKRVKGFLFSYLPTLSTKKPVARPTQAARPGLPLPPDEVLKKSRGPIATPARAPVPKARAPKELVNLQPAPERPKPSHVSKLPKPQRLVQLNHVPIDEIVATKPADISRNRRSSGGSVKDLVRSFEDLDKKNLQAERERAERMKRVRSIGDLKAGGKPKWKP
ncbi:hypothetical protein C8J56DRAFT_864924 [Mycena floridula]|nr:hypothetical protein C8J56DRAFT_864924 [Mycena floridula]